MDGTRVTVIGIIAILIGLLVGYLFWGYRSKQVESELTAAKAQFADAQKAADQGTAVAEKLKALEAQLKEVTASLEKERAARAELQARVSEGKK